jgi:hypothetical protein
MMELPYLEPLTVRPLADPVIPEPPRRGEPGGDECGICTHQATPAVWENEHFTMHPPVQGSLPGAVSAEAAAAFGPLIARVEQAILGLGGVGRVHLYRWGDGGAHFHVWMLPRPLGMLQATGAMLPIWEDVLPNVPDEVLAEAARKVAAAL